MEKYSFKFCKSILKKRFNPFLFIYLLQPISIDRLLELLESGKFNYDKITASQENLLNLESLSDSFMADNNELSDPA